MKKIILIIRSILFWIGFVSMVVLYGLFSPLLFLIPYKSRYPIAITLNKILMRWLKITCHLDYKVYGKENIPKDEPVIVFSNHESSWETVAFGAIFPRFTWVTKKILLHLPFFGWFFSLLRPVAINRSNGRQALKQVKEMGKARLDDGTWVIIFPEGTRVKHGTKGEYKAGGAILAKYAKYNVLPVAHNGGKYWPKHTLIKYPGTVTLSIGKVIETTNLKTKEILQQAETWIENEKKTLE